MQKVSVIIPNYNGEQYIRTCLDSLAAQTLKEVPVIVVDNGSKDQSVQIIREEYPYVTLLELDTNYGFCRAVNEGIRAAQTEYVILLNNDVRVAEDFAEMLVQTMDADAALFSCQAKMLQMDRPELIDNAGDFYTALGWAVTRGKDMRSELFEARTSIFSACAGAAIYRRRLFEKVGYFDEKHFAYLEDVDIGYRARLAGFQNAYEPSAIVWHKGSAVTGSRHNAFKVRSAARNNLYLIYKNMPLWQFWINFPLLLTGWTVKFLFFLTKGLGGAYISGLWQGILMARKGRKVPYLAENCDNCWKIQLELWQNLRFLFRKNRRIP